jgi:multisubunit Na+/H+ antiporter MnhB subunit
VEVDLFMKNGKTIGMILFVAGIIILLGYGLYQGFEKLSLENIDAVIAIGVVALIIGLIVLFISIVIEQQEGKKKMKEEIKKEDLEP